MVGSQHRARRGRPARARGPEAVAAAVRTRCSPTVRTAPPRPGWAQAVRSCPGARGGGRRPRGRAAQRRSTDAPGEGFGKFFRSAPRCKAFTQLASCAGHPSVRHRGRADEHEEQRCPVHAVCLPSRWGPHSSPHRWWSAATPAAADHTDLPSRVTLMGSLMSELGCATDWSETCSLTDLLPVPGSPTCSPRRSPSLPGDPAEPFDYVYKVRLNGSWNENYGDATFGLPDGNIPLAIDRTTELRFTYDHATHQVTVGPAQAGGRADGRRPGARRGQPARGPHHARTSTSSWPTGSRTATTANDTASSTGTRLDHGYDPTDQAFYHGGDLQGLIEQPGLHRGPRHDGDLDDAVVQEQARAGRAGHRVAPATTATGSPTSRRSTRTSAPTTS